MTYKVGFFVLFHTKYLFFKQISSLTGQYRKYFILGNIAVNSKVNKHVYTVFI